MTSTLLTLTVALLTGACASTAGGPPEIHVDRTACSHCGMLISEPVYAAAYVNAPGESRVFDDIGCLLKAVAQETGSVQRFWFHDAATAAWTDGGAVVFVVSSDLRTPMGGGAIAYVDRAAAERTARQHRGTIIASLAELLARPRAQS
jgi:copper chaperone NosL